MKLLEYNQLVEEKKKTVRECFLFDSANINLINPFEKNITETFNKIECKTEE